MSNKKQILNSIATIAKRLGRAPSRAEFIAHSGISLYFVLHSFPRWNDAIRAAGLRPYSLNAKVDDRSLLEDWGKVVRRNRAILRYRGRLPRHVYRRQGKFSPHTLALRFGGWSCVPRAFRNFARGKRQWADVLAVLPTPVAHFPVAKNTHSQSNEGSACAIPPKPLQYAPLKGRPTYGNPTNFPGLRYQPVNEQGVVLLFGMIAKDLGFLVEAVQKEFPDCVAMRQVAPERWQRVQIEFEFESRNFRDHGHSVNGCDVIVCWRHNWPGCPKHIEVIELSRVIKSLTNCER